MKTASVISDIHHNLPYLGLGDSLHAQQAGGTITNTTIPCACHERIEGSALAVRTSTKDSVYLCMVPFGVNTNTKYLVALSYKRNVLITMMFACAA